MTEELGWRLTDEAEDRERRAKAATCRVRWHEEHGGYHGAALANVEIGRITATARGLRDTVERLGMAFR